MPFSLRLTVQAEAPPHSGSPPTLLIVVHPLAVQAERALIGELVHDETTPPMAPYSCKEEHLPKLDAKRPPARAGGQKSELRRASGDE